MTDALGPKTSGGPQARCRQRGKDQPQEGRVCEGGLCSGVSPAGVGIWQQRRSDRHVARPLGEEHGAADAVLRVDETHLGEVLRPERTTERLHLYTARSGWTPAGFTDRLELL